ncbi:MAG: hypothetical protein ING73_08165 [Rhodocyclaceae bacterium]|nr:hypothetical protein [Rhodocyclaceae bacterium]MCA3026243.1 hypothetical protein [Rhodocyclaceae bacterium]MCA3032097.1 hypothetical protein [Rhodocyclaceae bacterium]MCA3038178.1 hypothetical protein [Rhodocyclaceae bacterium]MCA3040892.1 hypothetical protein [Rhodocyclaceae bacterium]
MANTSQTGRAQHNETTKLKALAHFASSNSATEAAKATGLPVSTVQTWVQHPESDEYIVSVRQALRTHIAADLVTIAIEAQRAIQDRLANGDEVVIAGGQLIRRKVSAKDAAYILANTVNLHSMMTEETKQRTAHGLKQLAADLIASLHHANKGGKTIDATHTIGRAQ